MNQLGELKVDVVLDARVSEAPEQSGKIEKRVFQLTNGKTVDGAPLRALRERVQLTPP
jgi:hypothetical protein